MFPSNSSPGMVQAVQKLRGRFHFAPVIQMGEPLLAPIGADGLCCGQVASGQSASAATVLLN